MIFNTMKKNAIVISEARLRRIIEEELIRDYIIREGLWDDVKSGVKKLSKMVTEKFKEVALEWAATIKEKISQLAKVPDEVLKVIEALKGAMQETKESLPMDDTLKMAKEIGAISKEEALQAAQSDLEGPVHATAESLAESYILLSDRSYLSETRRLNEGGVLGVLGISLGIIGGIPLLLKGLEKLSRYLKAEKTANLFKKAHHVAHAFEEKVIDYAIPDRLSYAIYKKLFDKQILLSSGTEALSFEAYKSGTDKAREKTESLMYKAMLIYFAIQGFFAVLHAGASMLGFVEGTATTVKGIELAKGGSEVAKLVRAAGTAATETV